MCLPPSAPGYHQPDEGQDHCEPCPPGEYQSERGKAECRTCKEAQDSLSGSATCTLCADRYYRPHAHLPAVECVPCSTIRGVACGSNATIHTLNLTQGYWRHSGGTNETHHCKSDGSWTPCFGGADAGADGDGYCAQGYRGPRCELCDGPAYSRYFDKLEARCHDCGNMPARTAVPACVFMLLIALAALAGNPAIRRLNNYNICGPWLRWCSWAQSVWQETGMRYKVKMTVGFYQCLAAVPSVYNVCANA
jgi:hypothetical protein